MLWYSAPHGLGLVLDKVTRQGGPHTAGWEDQFEVGYIVLAVGFDQADAFKPAVRERVNNLYLSKCLPLLDDVLLLCVELDLRPVSLGKQGRDEQAGSDQQEENEANDVPGRPDERIGRHDQRDQSKKGYCDGRVAPLPPGTSKDETIRRHLEKGVVTRPFRQIQPPETQFFRPL